MIKQIDNKTIKGDYKMEITIPVPQSQLAGIKEEEINKVFQAFVGMDNLYVEGVKNYHEMAKETTVYNMTYLEEKRKEFITLTQGMQKEYVAKANEIVDELIQGHSVKAEIKPVPSDKQERVAYELERQNDMKQWELKLQVADFEQLKVMYDSHYSSPDFQALINVKLHELEKSDALTYARLNDYVENMKTNPAIKELESLKGTLVFFGNSTLYPYNLQNGSLAVDYRNVMSDLTIPENFNL